MNKAIRASAAALALTITLPATAQTAAPTYLKGNQVTAANATVILDAAGNPLGSVTHPFPVLPLFTVPVAYNSATVFNALPYASVILTCTVAPSAGTINVSPDNAGDFIGQTAVLNTASGITTTATINSAGVYTISGHQYVQATFTGGTCFIAGGQ
jgi:hypothetical protein